MIFVRLVDDRLTLLASLKGVTRYILVLPFRIVHAYSPEWESPPGGGTRPGGPPRAARRRAIDGAPAGAPSLSADLPKKVLPQSPSLPPDLGQIYSDM